MLILEGTDPSKGNAQVARCTGGVTANGWDMISSALNHILIHSLSDQKRGNCSEANSHFGQ